MTLLLLGVAAAGFVLPHFGWNGFRRLSPAPRWPRWWLSWRFIFWAAAPPPRLATTIAGDMAKIRRLYDACYEQSGVHYQQEQARIKNEFEETKRTLNLEWKQAARSISQLRGTQPATLGERASRLGQKNDAWLRAGLERTEQAHADTVARLKSEETRARPANRRGISEQKWPSSKATTLACGRSGRRIGISRSRRCAKISRRLIADADKLFPAWSAASWKNWTPPQHFQNAAKFARFEVDVAKFCEAMPKDPRLAGPCAMTISLPLSLVCPAQGSILFETGKASGDEAVERDEQFDFPPAVRHAAGQVELHDF